MAANPPVMPLARLVDDLRNVSGAGAAAAQGEDWDSVARFEVIRMRLLGELADRAASQPEARDALVDAMAWGEPIQTALDQGRARLNMKSGEAAKANRAGAAYARARISA